MIARCPQTSNGPGRRRGAAVGFAAGELPQHNIADNGRKDPIAALIAVLDLAAISCRPMHIQGRAPVQVRRIAGGYAIGRRP